MTNLPWVWMAVEYKLLPTLPDMGALSAQGRVTRCEVGDLSQKPERLSPIA